MLKVHIQGMFSLGQHPAPCRRCGAEHPWVLGTGDLHLVKGLNDCGFVAQVVAEGSHASL